MVEGAGHVVPKAFQTLSFIIAWSIGSGQLGDVHLIEAPSLEAGGIVVLLLVLLGHFLNNLSKLIDPMLGLCQGVHNGSGETLAALSAHLLLAIHP